VNDLENSAVVVKDPNSNETIEEGVWKDAESDDLKKKLGTKRLALIKHIRNVVIRAFTCDDLEVVVHEVGLLLPLDELVVNVIVQPFHLVHPSYQQRSNCT
jgi:hypothetical protein